MKRHITYIAMLLTALTGASCSQDETPAGDGRTGVMAMTISTSRAEDNGEYDPLQYQKVYIYNSEGGLLRKYAAKDDIPERLELLSGTYRVAVEAGEQVPADFSKRFYKGEETFTVKPGETTHAEVVCKIANTVVEVKFDASIVENLDPGYFVWIAGTDKFDEAEAESGAVPALKFTDEGTGYYTLPAGTTSLAWMFRGTHTSGKQVEMENTLTEVKAGGKYVFTFRYSPGPAGLYRRPADPRRYRDGRQGRQDYFQSRSGPSHRGIRQRRGAEIHVRREEIPDHGFRRAEKIHGLGRRRQLRLAHRHARKYNTELTLSDAFFAGLAGGDHAVTIHVEDANGGSNEISTTYRLQGLVPVTEKSYDLWANTVTLQVVDFTRSANVTFGLCGSDGQWKYLTGTSQGDDFISATYAPEWENKTEADWSTPNTVLPYSRIKDGTGISAGNTYDYKATINGAEHTGQFTTQAGNAMTDGSLETWRSDKQFPGSGTKYTFWGSGYNSFAKDLCTRDDTMPGRVGSYCAKLTATYNTLAKVPAPGNLFTGDFGISLVPMGGNVSFGKNFTYNARPKAIKFKYHATIGLVDYNLHEGKIPVGEMDKARVFVCIVDWSAQQKVFAGTKAPTGTWDPETQTEAANGPIIGYASKFIDETTPGDEMVEITMPINYYQNTAVAPQGKFNIAVSCATSAYGDFMDACTTNVMYIDDFEWVY